MSHKVLLVEDEDDIREIAALSLELQGWEVVPVASGAACLAALAEHRPEAVLLDVMMPGQDGPATLAALRALPEGADVPVLFLTAKTQPKERAELLALGAAGVIGKPFDPLTLADDVAAALGWSA